MAPDGLLPQIKKVIYNGVDTSDYFLTSEKDDYFTIIASMSPDKGQGTAARACNELGLKLKMAGTIGGSISTTNQMEKELRENQHPDDKYVNYFKEEVAPYLVPGQIEYIGKIKGDVQRRHFAKAKAFLFPIDWEEPFGMAVVEALASGTPVIAYNRGAMPEIIEHGVNGFLAENYTEFKKYIKRIDEIDPVACRKSVEDKFSTEIMAKEYVRLYEDIIKRYWTRRVKNLINTRLVSPRLLEEHTALVRRPK